ncbi:hypothetical protein MYU51_002491 [Penicillium brevicompactum]
MILDQDGDLVWFKEYATTYNLNIQSFRGEDYLTFWAGNDGIGGHGDGTYYMLNSQYEEVYKIRGAGGLPADMHEFHITRDDTAVFALYDTQPADLRAVGGPENGWIYDGVFQEVDVETNKLLFQWRASDHFKFTDSYRGLEERGSSKDVPWDFFHINSIDKDFRGNFLVSSRYMSCLTYVDGRTGDVIWRLGGKHNSFQEMPNGTATKMKWQHHARFHTESGVGDSDSTPRRSITLFDNSSRGKGDVERTSRGLFVDIDEQNMTVQVRHEYWNPLPISSQSQGSLQVLENGNILVGYGYNAAWTEFSMDGEVLCQVHFGPAGGFGSGNIISYRTFKHHWIGKPTSFPDVAYAETHVAVSWNGATEVSTWVLEGTEDLNHSSSQVGFVAVSVVPKTGFETDIPVPADMPYQRLRVLALDLNGEVLCQTTPVDWNPKQFRDEVLVVPGDSELLHQGDEGKVLLLVLIPLATALAGYLLWLGRERLRLSLLMETLHRLSGQKSKHESWLPLRSSEEFEGVDGLDGLEDLEESGSLSHSDHHGRYSEREYRPQA